MPATTKTRTGAAQINVYIREGLVDAVGDGLLPDIADLGISGVTAVRHIAVYTIQGRLAASAPRRIGAELLADPVTQEFSIGEPPEALTHGAWVAHVKYNTGVTDSVGETAVKGITDLGISGVTAVRTSKIYVLRGRVKKNDVDAICRRLLANSVIQTYSIEKK
jgi:phosphoribosylformylglycinamidine synthase subunit PurS